MPRNPDLPCARCGQLMWRSTTSLPKGQATCQPCRRRQREETLGPQRRCAWCADVTSRTPYCSKKCGYQARSDARGYEATSRATCEVCGAQYRRKGGPRQRACSRACGGRLGMTSGSGTERPCRSCAQAFRPTREIQVYCSRRCQKVAHARHRSHCRRVLIKAQAHDRIELTALAARDGWRCHLCHRKVRRSEASIDHLEPLSLGGSHTWQNVALAHRTCNSRRSNRGPAQLLLIAS